MSETPIVSVVIPTYRHQDYVTQAIESVFRQTLREYEVIVVNDGSPDQTAARLAPLAESGKIRYFEQANAGQAAARNRGLGAARGRYVAFFDDDDRWPPNKLEWQVGILDRSPDVGMVAGDVADLSEFPRGAEKPLDGPRSLDFESLFSGVPGVSLYSPGQALMRTELVRRSGGFDEAIWGADDFDLYMRLARKMRIAVYTRVALFYREHADNASRDFGRLFANTAKVIRKQLPHVPRARRAAVRARADAWLYEWGGRRLVRQAKGRFRRGEWRAGVAQMGGVVRAMRFGLLRPGIAGRAVRDFRQA